MSSYFDFNKNIKIDSTMENDFIAFFILLHLPAGTCLTAVRRAGRRGQSGCWSNELTREFFGIKKSIVSRGTITRFVHEKQVFVF